MSSFEFTDEDGGRFAVKPLPGVPYVLLMTDPEGAAVPLDRVEEVVAGLRDMARQAGGAAPQPLTVHIEMGNTDALKAAIRKSIRRGPEEAGA
jgi:hypothetical protein